MFEKLTDINYLSVKMFENVDSVTLEQLHNCAANVSKKKNKFAISDMCSAEIKIALDCLNTLFARKYKKHLIELDSTLKKHFEKENLIEWAKEKCVIFHFPLATDLCLGAG